MKVALVCDWLTNVGGAEKVLLELHRLYPKAPIYTSQYRPEKIDWFDDADVRTGWLQKFPAGLRRVLGPLRQWYFSRLDLSEYDLVISVTGAEAKAVKSGKWLHANGKSVKSGRRLHADGKSVKRVNGLHISYCHVPTQYYWQMYDTYMKNPGFGVLNPLVRFCFRLMVSPLRRADLKAAQRPDYFVTISEYSREMIRKYYGREAVVIHPPVEVTSFQTVLNDASRARSRSRPSSRGSRSFVLGSSLRKIPQSTVQNLSEYYITTSRQVNWKRIDLAVKACMMTQRKLLVIGEGPEHNKLVKMAAGSGLVEFLPVMKKEELAKYLAGAKGYLFPSLEPFGIAPVEALAAGCPVIAFGEGGACDYVVDGVNGVLFRDQTAKSLAEAIIRFEKMKFDRKKVSASAKDFGARRFDKEMKDFVKRCEKKK